MDQYFPRPFGGPDNMRRGRHPLLALATGGLLLLLAAVLGGAAQQREPDKDTTAMIQASYIYNIAKLVQWRDPAMQ